MDYTARVLCCPASPVRRTGTRAVRWALFHPAIGGVFKLSREHENPLIQGRGGDGGMSTVSPPLPDYEH